MVLQQNPIEKEHENGNVGESRHVSSSVSALQCPPPRQHHHHHQGRPQLVRSPTQPHRIRHDPDEDHQKPNQATNDPKQQRIKRRRRHSYYTRLHFIIMIRRILLLLLVVVVLLWSRDDYDGGGGRSLLLSSSWSNRRFMVHAMVWVVAHPPQPQRLSSSSVSSFSSSSFSSSSLPWGSSQRTSHDDDGGGWYRRRRCRRTRTGPVSSLPPGRSRSRTTTAVWSTKRDWEEESRHNEENNNNNNTHKNQPLVPRGGGELGEPQSEPHSQSQSGRQRGRRRQGMIAFTLALSYFTIMGAKCALPTVLPMLLSTSTSGSSSSSSSLSFAPGQDPTTSLQQMVTWSTIAIAVGKLVLGPLIDAVGGSWALTSLLTLLSSLFLVLSVTTRFTTFGRAYIAIDFFFSAGWPACIHAIHQYFAPHQWGARIGQLAMGARAGNAVAFAVFAQLLQQPQSSFNNKWTTQWFPSCWQDQAWRRIFALCSVIQWIPLILLSLFCKHHNHRLTRTLTNMTTTPLTPESNNCNSTNNKAPIQTKPVGPSFSSLWSSLQRTWSIAWGQAQTVGFWLQFINRSVLMVFASMLLFVPTVLCQLYQTSSAVGAQAGSLYATGCLLAVWLGAQPYATLARPHEDGNENDDHDRQPHASHPATLTNGSTNHNTTTTTIPKWSTTRTYRHVAVLLFLLSSATAASAIHWAHASPRLPWLTLSPSLAALAFLVWGAAMAIPFYSTFVSVCGGDGGAIVVVSRLFSISL